MDGGGYFDDLDRVERDVRDRGNRVVRASTLQGEALSKAFAPVSTGALRASVTSEFRSHVGAIEGEFGPTVHYAAFVNRGTSRMAPNPHNDRAADIIEPQFYAAVGALLGPT